MRKGLLIGLVVLLGLVSIPFIFLRLAFGLLHDTITIDVGREGTLICEETYNGDFAGEFYDVKMTLKDLNEKEYGIGSVTFREQNWSTKITTKRTGNWLIILARPAEFVRLKALNVVTGQLNDTTLKPFDLRKDPVYKKRFKDTPDHLYPGTSRITDTSEKVIEVDFEYKTKTEYPTELVVTQKVIYRFDSVAGQIKTQAIEERVVQ